MGKYRIIIFEEKMALQRMNRQLNGILQIKNIIPTIAYMSDLSKFYGKVDLSRLEQRNRRGARRPRLVKDLTPEEIKHIKEANTDWRPYYKDETFVPISPLSRNPHPVNNWVEDEEKIKEEALSKSSK